MLPSDCGEFPVATRSDASPSNSGPRSDYLRHFALQGLAVSKIAREGTAVDDDLPRSIVINGQAARLRPSRGL